MPDIVRAGAVAWTGDNPFIYLKTNPDGDWSSLSLFFRITTSVAGRGHLSLVVERPYEEHGDGMVRLALTDNEQLARFLLDKFVSKFVLFRPSSALDTLELVPGAEFTQNARDDSWSEMATAQTDSGQRSIELIWNQLGTPFAVDVPPEKSGTGAHEMFSVFRIAQSAQVTVDGNTLPGATILRDFLNGPGQSAGMALSETWVEE